MHMISMCLIKLMLKPSDNCTYICTCKLKLSLNVHHAKLLVQYCIQYMNSDLGFPFDLMVKNLSAKQEMWVQSLGHQDPLEKEMATHSSILAKKSHEQWILLGYSPWVHERVRSDSANKQQQILIVIQSQYRIISLPQETTPAPTLDSSFSFTSTFSSSFPMFLKQLTDICFGKNKCLHGVNPFVSGLL